MYADFFDKNISFFEIIHKIGVSPEWRMKAESVNSLKAKYYKWNRMILTIFKEGEREGVIKGFDVQDIASFFAGMIHSTSAAITRERRGKRTSFSEKIPSIIKFFYCGIGYKNLPVKTEEPGK